MTVQVRFDSHYSSPVRLAVLLVNGLTPGEERGRPRPRPDDPAHMATIALRSVDPGLPEIGAAEATRLAEYAGLLRDVFAAADPDAGAAAVQRVLTRTRPEPYMARHDEDQWHVHFRGTAGGAAAEWAGACAAALAHVLGGDARHRLGVCTAAGCDRVYVDTSHNGTRRFCSTPCQNRVKTAAFRARGRASG